MRRGAWKVLCQTYDNIVADLKDTTAMLCQIAVLIYCLLYYLYINIYFKYTAIAKLYIEVYVWTQLNIILKKILYIDTMFNEPTNFPIQPIQVRK